MCCSYHIPMGTQGQSAGWGGVVGGGWGFRNPFSNQIMSENQTLKEEGSLGPRWHRPPLLWWLLCISSITPSSEAPQVDFGGPSLPFLPSSANFLVTFYSWGLWLLPQHNPKLSPSIKKVTLFLRRWSILLLWPQPTQVTIHWTQTHTSSTILNSSIPPSDQSFHLKLLSLHLVSDHAEPPATNLLYVTTF